VLARASILMLVRLVPLHFLIALLSRQSLARGQDCLIIIVIVIPIARETARIYSML